MSISELPGNRHEIRVGVKRAGRFRSQISGNIWRRPGARVWPLSAEGREVEETSPRRCRQARTQSSHLTRAMEAPGQERRFNIARSSSSYGSLTSSTPPPSPPPLLPHPPLSPLLIASLFPPPSIILSNFAAPLSPARAIHLPSRPIVSTTAVI